MQINHKQMWEIRLTIFSFHKKNISFWKCDYSYLKASFMNMINLRPNRSINGGKIEAGYLIWCIAKV